MSGKDQEVVAEGVFTEVKVVKKLDREGDDDMPHYVELHSNFGFGNLVWIDETRVRVELFGDKNVDEFSNLVSNALKMKKVEEVVNV